jgi:hypothetical protein
MKVNMPLFLIKHHAIKVYGGVDEELHAFLFWDFYES